MNAWPVPSPALVIGVGFVVLLITLLAGFKVWLRLLGVVLVPETSIGIVTVKYVLAGRNRRLPDGAIVALEGEAGIQADTLAPGVHSGYWPWQYRVDFQPFTKIPEGHVGVVEARDGTPLAGGRILGRAVPCGAFQNAREFLRGGGERGPQIAVITPGTYRINTSLFSVGLTEAIDVGEEKVGIVTTRDGAPLPSGDIAGREIQGHNSFQNGQAFIDGGGSKGLQEQVVLAGRYYLNPLFATIEVQDMAKVPIASVGVVIAYVGLPGVDVTGADFKHGNLVTRGQRGVWNEPLDPGKYPINPFTHRVEVVPTANVVLNWATGKTEAHKLDERLSTIKVRSADGFTFMLDVSQIIHVPRNEAPKVIARFGSMQNLITQVLEPTIGNYFRIAAQRSDVIEFLKARDERQKEAKDRISAALDVYDVSAVDTLIGDIVPPEELMKTLTDRKIAGQQKVTFAVQQEAAQARQELAQVTAMADTQPDVVRAERQVSIREFEAKATVKSAEGLAKSTVLTATGDAEANIKKAEADARRITLVGDATAQSTKAVGNAEAEVVSNKIKSMESGNYAGIEIAKALAAGKVKLVPDVQVGATGADATIGTLLMASMFRRDNLDRIKADDAAAPHNGSH